MKLELKHLCAYLPYGVKVMMEGKLCNIAWVSKKNICIHRPNSIGEMKKIKWEYAHLNFKPILRPLSDLTKEIEHNGERFVPNDMLRKLSGAFEPDDDLKNTFRIHISDGSIIGFTAPCLYLEQYPLFQKLLSWHFDIFGLIDAGLAIDMNTLKMEGI